MKKIGFIGLGIMGKPMVTHLLKADYPVLINDVNVNAVREIERIGGIASNYQEIASQSEVIILSLPNGHIVKNVVQSVDFFNKLNEQTIIVDTSSISPKESIEIADFLATKQIMYVDSPVSGGEEGAIAGTLSFMLGASKESFESLFPILNVMGSKVVRVGELGSGSIAKLVNQIIVNLNIVAISEAFTFCKEAGVDTRIVFEAIKEGYAGSAVMDSKMPKILEKDFQPGATISTVKKDINNVIEFANELNIPVPFTSQLFELQKVLVNQGLADEDHGAYIKYFEALAGITIQ